MKLKSAQKKSLSEFLNTIAVAWFTAGVIAPLFTISINKLQIIMMLFSILIASYILYLSLNMLRGVR